MLYPYYVACLLPGLAFAQEPMVCYPYNHGRLLSDLGVSDLPGAGDQKSNDSFGVGELKVNDLKVSCISLQTK